jgi:ParB family chromosome partitioning protein
MTTRKPLVTDERVHMPDPFAPVSAVTSAATLVTHPVLGEDYRLVPLVVAIESSPLQTRAAFDPEHDEDDHALLESLRAEGQRVPVLLVEMSETSSGYRLLDGHRRVAALRQLGHDSVKAVIQRAESLDCDLTTLTANVRKHFSPLEQARAIERLHERHGLTWDVIAQKTGLTTRWLRELRGLLHADPALQQAVENGELSARTAVELKDAPREHHAELAGVATAHHLNSAAAAQLVSRVKTTGESPEEAANALGLSAADFTATSRASAVRSLLDRTFPELDEARRATLAEAASQFDAKDNVIKLAGLLVLGGDTSPDALQHAATWVRAGGVRQLIALVDGLARLQQRPIAPGAQTPPWKAGLARKVSALPPPSPSRRGGRN